MRFLTICISTLIPLISAPLTNLAQDGVAGIVASSSDAYVINSNSGINPLKSTARIAVTPSRAGIAYSSPYLLKDLHSVTMYAALKRPKFSPGMSIGAYGNAYLQMYTQQVIIARQIEKRLALGIGINHLYINYPTTYVDESYICPSIGASLDISPSLRISSNLQNIALNKHYLQQKYHAGISYTYKRLSIHCQLDVLTRQPLSVEMALEYNAHKNISTFAKTSTGKEPICLGVDLLYNNVNISFKFAYHRVLGTTPMVDLSLCKQNTL